jgi:4-carboxymuconolactone decarboxylase
MARIDDVKVEDLTPRQKKIYDDIMLTRPRAGGGLGGPFSVWLRTPDIAEHTDRLTNAFRVSSKLDKRLIELIILIVCRDATAKYAWGVHEPLGVKAGLAQDDVDAIRARRKPEFKRDDERMIYDVVTELLTTKHLAQATYDRAVAMFGLEGVIEVVSCAGCYGMIGLVLNVFEIPPRAGVPLS